MSTKQFDRVFFSADDDESKWRVERLRRAFIYAVGRLHPFENCQSFIDENVARLHDHEGTLTVTWRRRPYSVCRTAFDDAWCGPFGDGCNNVEHVVEHEESGTT